MQPDETNLNYSITPDGYFPEVGHSIRYEGGGHRFWFFPKLIDNGDNTYDVVVTEASTERFFGHRPTVPPEDRPIIETRVANYLNMYDRSGLKLRPHDHPRNVKIKWTLLP